MNDAWDDRVRHALARHLKTDPLLLGASDRLGEDLGLDALDLVLIVLAFEEQAKVEFPMGDLQSVRTVADLASLTRAWLSAHDAGGALGAWTFGPQPGASRPTLRARALSRGGPARHARPRLHAPRATRRTRFDP
jgi:acyl carrier protein